MAPHIVFAGIAGWGIGFASPLAWSQAAVGPAGAPPHPVAVQPSADWRQPARCGPNALYALLRFEGHPVTLDQVLRAAPPNDRGVSLEQLRQAAGQLGQVMRVVRKTPRELGDVPTPAIAHLSNTRDGHYVVLLRAQGDTVIVCDAVECAIEEVPASQFARDWSGFLLVKDSPWPRRRRWMLALAGTVLAGTAAASSRLARGFVARVSRRRRAAT